MTEDTTDRDPRLDNPILHWPNDPRIPGCNEHCHRAAAPDAGLREAENMIRRLVAAADLILRRGGKGGWIGLEDEVHGARKWLAARPASAPDPRYDGFPLDVDAIHRAINEAGAAPALNPYVEREQSAEGSPHAEAYKRVAPAGPAVGDCPRCGNDLEDCDGDCAETGRFPAMAADHRKKRGGMYLNRASKRWAEEVKGDE